MDALKSLAALYVMFLPMASHPAGADQELPPASTGVSSPEQDEQLDEVFVSGARQKRQPSEILEWLRRLAGQFAYEGHVDTGGQGNPAEQRPVAGDADCRDYWPTPAVLCEVRVTWPQARGPGGEEIPGGASNLDPAMLLFSNAGNGTVIRLMQVDSEGIAEPSQGALFDDTFVSRAPCAGRSGNCERLTRITAKPDLTAVDMNVDIEVDHQRVLRYRFVLRRMPGGSQ